MKWMLIMLLIVAAMACSRGVVVNLGERMPDPVFIQDQDAAFQEGWEWIQKGDPDRAIRLFQLSNAPLYRKHVAFAYAFLAKSKPGLAREHFQKSLALEPENLEAELGLASTLETAEERENAFHIYSRLMAKYPDLARVKTKFLDIKTTATQEYLDEAAKAKAAGHEDKYIKALVQASYYSPEMTAIEREIADFKLQKGKWDEALQHYKNLQGKDSNPIEILGKMIEIQENMHRLDQALLLIDQALILQPGDPGLEAKKKQVREKFLMLNLPPKFKEIFFKKEITREDLAALLGYYFQDYITIDRAPAILTDIDSSYARDEIIKVTSSGIIRERPNHTFDRFSPVDRASFAEVVSTLIKYLETKGYALHFPPMGNSQVPLDISLQHKNYTIITFLIQSQLIPLDSGGNFNPTAILSPTEAVAALQKVLASMLQ